jgi:DNA sulfur modification protein DndE
MKFNKIILSEDVTKKLQILKSKTGLTPNILCRFGLLLSLRDNTMAEPSLYKQDGQEIYRHILFGDQELIYITILLQKAATFRIENKNDKENIEFLRANINRGGDLLYNRLSRTTSLKDLLTL